MCLFQPLLAALALGLVAQQDPVEQPLFESHETLRMWLATDLETLVRDIGRDTGDYEFEGQEEHAAAFSYLDAAGDTVTLEITAETRGHFRRDRSHCNFPPLRLDFRKKGQDGTPRENSLFRGQNKLKLATHCQDGRDEYEQFLIQEYLLYRTYNLLNDKSFRVRLALITYVDTAGRRNSITKYAFLIEHENRLGERIGGEGIDTEGIHPLDLEFGTMAVLATFQYMVRNTDWSVQGMHNINLYGPIEGLVYPVPFDFDWAGVIAPPYAHPDPDLEISSVRDPLFTGYCRSLSEFEHAFTVFNRQQSAVYALHRGQEGLDAGLLDRMLEDYDRFYHIINRPREVERTILRQCKRR